MVGFFGTCVLVETKKPIISPQKTIFFFVQSSVYSSLRANSIRFNESQAFPALTWTEKVRIYTVRICNAHNPIQTNENIC